MTEQKNKFAMELVWHNCLTYKPEEKFKFRLSNRILVGI